MKKSARQPHGAEYVPASQEDLCRYVGENASSQRQPLYAIGGGTALDFGYPPSADGVAVDLSQLARVVDYPARDMTITVEAGIGMESLAGLLRSEGQRLPIDVPHADRATLGGVVATAASGPRRFGFGTMRDYVIGLAAVDARGRRFHSGGRVVKNVAGYDMCKLLVGSLGTLGFITELTLKLKPVPAATAHVWSRFDSFSQIDAALERLLTSQARPVSLEVLDQRAAEMLCGRAELSLPAKSPVLCVGVEGSQAETAWQSETLQRELAGSGAAETQVVAAPKADRLWAALTGFQADSDSPLTFQANLTPSKALAFIQNAVDRGVAVQAHAGNGIVVGHLPAGIGDAPSAEQILAPLRDEARQCRGNLVVLACDPEWKQTIPVFGHPEPSWPLMRQLKQALDPDHLLNTGRFIDRD